MVGKVTSDTMMSASRLPALFGVSKFSTPQDELETSIGALDGAEIYRATNEAMRWGNEFEWHILQESARRLNLKNLQTAWPEAQRHAEWPLQCSLDAMIDGDGRTATTTPEAGIFCIGAEEIVLQGPGVLEAKLTRVWPEKAPAVYRGPLQLQGQMAIMGASWGAVCVLYQGVELRIFLFEADLNVQEAIRQKVVEFDGKLRRYQETGVIEAYPELEASK